MRNKILRKTFSDDVDGDGDQKDDAFRSQILCTFVV